MPKGKKKPIEQVLSGSGGLIKKSDINCHDVIKGRGHSTNNNPGNVHFKNRIRDTQSEYFTSTNAEKKFVAAKLVAGIRNADPSGRFLELAETTDEGEFYKEIGDKDAWKKTMQALREGAPNVREELSAMENLTQVDVGSRKRGQGDISGNVEEQPQRPRHDFLAIAQECAQRMIQNNAEDEEAASSTGEGDAAPKRVQVQWRTRFDEVVDFKRKYGHTRVQQNYFPNPPLGRWVQKQRTEYSNRMQGKVNHLNDEKLQLLEGIGFVWNCHTTENSDCDAMYDDTDIVQDLVEESHPFEQGDQDLDGMVFNNARALFEAAGEVRKRHMNQIRKNYRAPSTSTSADNNSPKWSDLGDLPYETLEIIISFFRSGDDWKRKMSQVSSEWRSVALRLEASIYKLSPAILLNVFGCLRVPEAVRASQTCHMLDDLLSRALLRPELLPCCNDEQWSPLFQIADKVLENANKCTQPLFPEDVNVPKYEGFERCEDCGRKIAHPPSQSDGTTKKYKHVCCSPEFKRGVNEIRTIADCVSRSGSLNSDEKTSIIDELVCSSGIPEAKKEGRYFKKDANSPELSINSILSDLFTKIITQGESFQEMCEKTYSILGRRQQVLLSILVAFVVHVGPCKVGSTGSGESDDGKLIALPRTNDNGADAYNNALFIREAPFAVMKFDNLQPCRSAEGFLIAAGSLLGTVVNKRLEHQSQSIPETSMVYFAGLRTESLWEHGLNHASLHHDYSRRLLPSNGKESEGLSDSPAISEDERQVLEQELALERQRRLDERHAYEQQLSEERQRRLALERRLDEERRSNAEQEQRMSAEQQRRSAEMSAEMAEILGKVQEFQQKWMNS